jgi:hypothetical protein
MTTLKYRGRVVTAQDILYIRELDRGTSTGEPTRLSEKLCVAWQWSQADGALRDMGLSRSDVECWTAGISSCRW